MPLSMASETLRALISLPRRKQPAGDVAAVRAPEDAHRELGAAGAHEAGDADDLPRAHGEAGTVDHLAVLGRVPDGPVLDPEDLLTGVRRPLGVEALQVAADHAADDAFLGDLAGVQVQRLDGLPVPDDGDLVGD